MSLGDLTVQQALKRKKTTVTKNMTVGDFIAACSKLGPVVLALVPALAAVLLVLKTLNTLLNTAVSVYHSAVQLYQQVKKALAVAQSAAPPPIGDSGITAAQNVTKEAQKTVVNSAKQAIEAPYTQAKTYALQTPLRTLSGGSIP